MRKVEKSIVIRQGSRDLWTRLARPECWQALTEAFAGSSGRFRYRMAGDGSQPLAVGAEVDVTTPQGKPVMHLRISEWAPPKSLELSVDESRRKLTPFHMILRFELEELEADSTRLTLSLVIIYMNRLLEILSLVLPIGFVYSRGLDRALTHLRDSG